MEIQRLDFLRLPHQPKSPGSQDADRGFGGWFMVSDQAVAASSSSSKDSFGTTIGSGSSTVNSNSASRW